jgi:FkbM family methyltransferase
VQGFKMRLSAQEWIQRKLIEDGVHEWAETAILPTFVRRGWTAFDIGANIGCYSLILSRLVGPEGRVYAFEPNPLARERLEEHVAINGTSNVEVTSLALGERLGEGRFRFDPDAPTSHEVPNWGSWSLARSRRAGNVNVTFSTADLVVRACAIERVHFMKIDVEGLELSVLRGAPRDPAPPPPLLPGRVLRRRRARHGAPAQGPGPARVAPLHHLPRPQAPLAPPARADSRRPQAASALLRSGLPRTTRHPSLGPIGF